MQVMEAWNCLFVDLFIRGFTARCKVQSADLAIDPWASVGSVCWYKVTDVMKLRE